MLEVAVSVFFLIWYIIIVGMALLGLYGANQMYEQRSVKITQFVTSDTTGVSILRPLCGLDPDLYANLKSSFMQSYPTFEVIFAVAHKEDPSLGVVRRLMAQFPEAKARISVGIEEAGVNPKVNVLLPAFRMAKYDILWVCDSNIHAAPHTLARAVQDLLSKPNTTSVRVGIVHHVPIATVATNELTLGSRLEMACLNTTTARMYIALNMLGIDSCTTGKSNLYHRSDIERINGSGVPLHRRQQEISNQSTSGLASVARFIAEDAMIGRAIWHELGLRHVLSADVVANVVGPMSVSSYLARRVRWVRVRKSTFFFATLLEPFTESILMGVLLATSIRSLTSGSVPSWIILVAHLAFCFAVDLQVMRSLTEERLNSWADGAWFVTAWMLRESLAIPVWIYGVLGTEILWRGERYRLLRGGEALRVYDKKGQ